VNRLRLLSEVARWEFRRYVKPGQQVLGAVIFLLMLLGGAALGRLGSDPSALEIRVVGSEQLSALPEESGRFRFVPQPADALPELVSAIAEDEASFAAVLVLDAPGSGRLHVRQSPGWLDALERELSVVLQVQRMDELALDPATLAALQTPFRVEVDEAAPRGSGAERLWAMGALGLGLLGILSGIGYIFSSVTGEKQNRLSEQVISAIHAQTWIDGKILGLSGVAGVAVLNALVSGAAFLLVARILWDWSLTLPTGLERPELLAVALVLIGLGFLFWFALLVAVAAIMEDPHTSMRTQFMFLPMLPLIPAFLGVGDADATWMRVLGILPPTSSAVLPVRILVTEVPWWEVGLSLALLCLAVWAMSRIAGRVFRVGMLMYGKEPTWGEVRRWVREA
jgi:ABC-2 type transport system permease protein